MLCISKFRKRLFSTWCLGPSYDQILATPLTVREFPIAISLKKRVYVQVEKICKRLFSTWCLGPSYDQILATPLTVGEFPIAISLKKRVYVQVEKQEGVTR
jgi:hypothetical protein